MSNTVSNDWDQRYWILTAKIADIRAGLHAIAQSCSGSAEQALIRDGTVSELELHYNELADSEGLRSLRSRVVLQAIRLQMIEGRLEAISSVPDGLAKRRRRRRRNIS